ncbi:MMPL family transporter [Streptomyces sp. BE308]|uniref:MMPL family transporter n=1 Tax=Streptomyces sp. BE308 TaxID=3002529 RepID=UPI002E7A8263|nr:MMPL family transporter [Streptomyces sp. BE308]MEE1795759.1 MMPL family transporter [Streptomyces sp. BE308]
MTAFLYRPGRLSFRKRRLLVLIWVALLAAAVLAAVKAPAAADDGVSIPGTESQDAFDLLDRRLPGVNSDGAEARIVFVAPDGQKITASANRAAVEEVVDEVGRGSQVAGALSPSAPGRSARTVRRRTPPSPTGRRSAS